MNYFTWLYSTAPLCCSVETAKVLLLLLLWSTELVHWASQLCWSTLILQQSRFGMVHVETVEIEVWYSPR